MLFAQRGYKGTSIRDIGNKVGMLGGSLYHYIKSKEALFVAVHDSALDRAQRAIEGAVKTKTCPWDRLHVAIETLFQWQLDPSSITMPIMNDFRSVPDGVREKLVARRDQFEHVFTMLITALPLDKRIDRRVFRLSLLTLANNSAIWYRPGGLSPSEIATQIMLIFRHEEL